MIVNLKLNINLKVKLAQKYFTILKYILVYSITNQCYGQDIDLINYIKNQNSKPGSDGYLSMITNTTQLSKKQDNLTIIFINGIKNGFNEGKNSAYEVSGKIGRRVIYIYSSSIGNIADIKKAFDIRYGGLNSDDMMSLYNFIIHEISRNQKVRVFAHSRGAAVTYRVAKMLTSRDNVDNKNDLNKILSNLEIITLGGFAPVASNWPLGVKVYDLVNQYDLIAKYNDDVPFFDSLNPKKSIKEHPLSNYINSLQNYKAYNLQIQWRSGF